MQDYISIEADVFESLDSNMNEAESYLKFYLTESMRARCVRGGYKRLQADLTHEVFINLK